MHRKDVKIGDVEVTLEASAYTPILYAETFGNNVFGEMNDIILSASETGNIPFDKLAIIYRMAYCMAKHADENIKPFKEWLKQFDVLDVLDIVADIIDLWSADNQQQSSP